jgi:hypothetical protein
VSGDAEPLRQPDRWLAPVLAIVAVVVCYTFFAGGGKFEFRRLRNPDDSYYASLAEGFFRGHLYMALTPDPRLVALPYPYDVTTRVDISYLWDGSYLNGRYYLYSSPLPVLLCYMPFRILCRAYPPDILVALIFSVWAFLVMVAFARRALTLTGQRLHIPFALWVLFIGLGNVATFVLNTIHMYEVAILTGMAMTATWAYASLRFSEAPSVRRGVWMNVWLALAIAARPNLGVLLLVTAVMLVVAARRKRPSVRETLAVMAPLAIVAVAMLWYNAARFGNPLEFGVRYQLTSIPMENRKVCSLCTFPELTRFGNNVMHYVFWPLHIQSAFPFLDAMSARMDRATAWPTPQGMTEQIIGIAPVAPLMILGTLLAVLQMLGFGRSERNRGTEAALHVMTGAWLILLGLSACWWIVARYSLDFMMLMGGAAVIIIEAGLTSLQAAGVRIVPLRLIVASLACYSILTGFLLGYVGPGDAFRQASPAVFRMISDWLK